MTGKKRTEKNEEAPPRREAGLVSFGEDVRKLIAPLLGRKGMIQADVIRYWRDILGADLASGVTPFSVSFSKNTEGAVLTVKAYSGAFAVEFTARKEQIIERLNSYFGYPAIADIRIKQGGTFTPQAPVREPLSVPAEKKAEIEEAAVRIENESLRESVIRLGLLTIASKKD